jgi:hypothetical protein
VSADSPTIGDILHVATNHPEAIKVLDAIAAYKQAIIADPADTKDAAHGLIDAIVKFTVATHPSHAVPSATARFADQHTSTRAGAAHDSDDLRRFSATSQQGLLLATIIDNNGLTAYEATQRVLTDDVAVSRFEGCRRRVSDLVRAGLIEDSETTRQNPGSNVEAIVWTSTSAGRTAYKQLLETGWSK